MDDLLQAILTNTLTLQSLHKRLRFLKDFYSAKFYNQQGVVFAQADLDWLNSLGDKTNQFNKDNLNEMLEALDKGIEKLQHLTAYFAIDLPEDKLEQLARFLRQNFKQQLLIDVKFDPLLIAGCALVYKGVYKDYSLKQTIEDNKEKVIETFKTFIK